MTYKGIRRAVPEDIAGIALLCVKYRKESNAFMKYKIDIDILSGHLADSFYMQDEILLVHEDKDRLDGVLWASKVPLLWADADVYIDNVLYVDQDARGSSVASLLIKGYEEIARYAGVDYIKLSSISGIETDKISNLYKTPDNLHLV